MSPPLPSHGRAASLPGEPRAPRPDVDERLVMPETRYEAIDGKACSDAAVLDAWFDRIVGAKTAAEVLSPRPARPKKRR